MLNKIERLGRIIADQPKSVIICVGAGVSARYGIPNWCNFNRKLFERFIAFKSTTKDNDISTIVADEKTIKDEWSYGEFLKEIIPDDKYITWIRDLLQASPGIKSDTYKKIWNLGTKGIISFNIDGIAADSNPSLESQNISYGSIDDKCLGFFIKQPWLYCPHGGTKRPESWVFTRESRNRLIKKDSYQRFFTTASTGYHIVFIGINPRDYQLEDILSKSAPSSRGLENHFWIKDEPNADDMLFAKGNGLELIPYSKTNNWSELDNILSALKEFSPPERNGQFAYYGASIPPESLEDDLTLSATANINEIREKLNAAAKGLMERLPQNATEQEKIKAYLDFTQQYGRSMKMTMHLKPNSPGNDVIFGYKVDQAPLGGAFGKVYRVCDLTTGEVSAVKIMRDDIFENEELLTAFRRGALASKILTDRSVNGMVKYKGSYEIPPCIFMEHIDGPTLQTFVEEHPYDSRDIYGIIGKIAKIVKSAHDLPENVLHRDLKPQNIMIKDYYCSNCELNVDDIVLLDFDLSWYKGAIGNSIITGVAGTGYAAPEQFTMRRNRYSTQTTSVDVFSIGMLLFFMATKKHPYPGVYENGNFTEAISASVFPNNQSRLKSFRRSIAGLITKCATANPGDRIGMSDLIYYLDMMNAAESSDIIHLDNPILLNELAEPFLESGWRLKEISQTEVRIEALMSKAITIIADPTNGLKVSYSHKSTGAANRDRKHVVEWLNKKVDAFCTQMDQFKCLTTEKRIETAGFTVDVHFLDTKWSLKSMHKMSEVMLATIASINE